MRTLLPVEDAVSWSLGILTTYYLPHCAIKNTRVRFMLRNTVVGRGPEAWGSGITVDMSLEFLEGLDCDLSWFAASL